MAQHKSSIKRIRQTARRTMVNDARTSRIRTFIKNVEAAIIKGDKKAAQNALRTAQPEIARGVSQGIFKKETASRKISRLSARIRALSP